MFGFARGNALGRQLSEVLAAGPSEAPPSELAQSLAGADPTVLGKRHEVTAMRADRSTFPAEVSITRVELDGPPMFTAFIRDVAEAKQARAALLQSNSRLRALADVSGAFAMVVMNYQALLDKIAEVVTEIVGDGCNITLVSDDGQQLLNVASAHRDA